MTIPEDIRSAAARCIMNAAGNPRLDDIAAVIWEERQRCARVATACETNCDATNSRTYQVYVATRNMVCRMVAKAIMEPA